MPKEKLSFYQWCIENNKQHLLDEFDSSKNKVKPHEISYGSNKKMWWIDSYGMSWQTSVNRRTVFNGRSPYEDGKLPEIGRAHV